MKRSEHAFQFRASEIAQAAGSLADYHSRRIQYWHGEYERSVKRVKETASVKVEEFPVTGGKRAEVVVHYGDPSAYSRLTESYNKIQSHQKALAEYNSDQHVYGTQGERVYELDPTDVLHYRLDGSKPPETED